MKSIRRYILLSGLLLLGCGEEPFNMALIPGTYTGSLYYYEAEGDDIGTENIQLSTRDTYMATVASSGADYVITFQENAKFDVPDIKVQLFSIIDGKTGAIKTATGQTFTSSLVGGAAGQQPNYFSIDADLGRVDCRLTLKSTDPDSVYYLRLAVNRQF